MDKIKLGIVGYGNLGKGVESVVEQTEDIELVKIFTRRDPKSFGTDLFESLENINKYKDELDVLILALGSAKDIPEIAPRLAEDFNTVDCYDNHHSIPAYYSKIDQISKSKGHVAMVATGWDPGLFSINRLIAESILPQGRTYTVWGRGVSQGHSDALRKIRGVKNAVQYTVPKEEVIENIKDHGELSSSDIHDRVCYIVLEEGAPQDEIREKIVTMPDYFKGFDTEVNFISDEEFEKEHRGMPHGGNVIRGGETGNSNTEVISFNLELESNPEFTASVAVAAARATYKMSKDGVVGAKTILDTPPIYYSTMNLKEAIKKYI